MWFSRVDRDSTTSVRDVTYLYSRLKSLIKHAFKYHQLDSDEANAFGSERPGEGGSREREKQKKSIKRAWNIKWNNVTICEANYLT
jgi:hypothetical protein